MRITWYGHAAFLIEGENEVGEAVRVVLDPYRAPDVGTYAPIDDEADVVAISHVNEKYHSHIAGVRGQPEIVDGLTLLDLPQPQMARGVPFTAVRVWENDERREPIAMVGLTMEGIRILHMGDCGHALSPEEVAACGDVDVLLALAGGPPTLLIPDAAAFIRDLAPRVVIPMHFGNDKINLNLRPVTDLLVLMSSGSVRNLSEPSVEMGTDTLPGPTEVWVLPPAR